MRFCQFPGTYTLGEESANCGSRSGVQGLLTKEEERRNPGAGAVHGRLHLASCPALPPPSLAHLDCISSSLDIQKTAPGTAKSVAAQSRTLSTTGAGMQPRAVSPGNGEDRPAHSRQQGEWGGRRVDSQAFKRLHSREARSPFALDSATLAPLSPSRQFSAPALSHLLLGWWLGWRTRRRPGSPPGSAEQPRRRHSPR